MNKLHERIAKANEAAMAKFDEAAEATDAKRSEELLAEGTKHAEEAKRLSDIETARAETAARREADAARRLSDTPERSFAEEGRTKAEDRKAQRWALPAEAELEARTRAISLVRERGLHGVDEATAAAAKREWPVEDLFFDALRSRFAVLRGGAPTLMGERRTAWEAYVQRAQDVQLRLDSPIAGGQSTGAGKGGEFVPETWSSEIVANMAFYGPMADTALVRYFTGTNVGNFHVATVTDNETKVARIVPEQTKTTKDAVATDDVTLTPRLTAVQIPFTDQMLLSGNINLRAFISSDVPKWFGRKLNEWYTKGDGAGKPKGLDQIVKGGGNQQAIANRGAIAEKDIMDLFGKLDKAYLDMPNTCFQVHFATLLTMMQVRSGTGQRVFPLTMDRKSVNAPPIARGVDANNAIDSNATAGTTTIGIVGDLDAYGVINVGGMNVEMQRNLDSFQWLMSWAMFQDGQPLNENAFAFLQNKT